MDVNLRYAVTTCDRPVSYLDQTLDSLAAADFDAPVIVQDEYLHGPLPTFRKALRVLLSEPCDAVMGFQDDIQVAAGLREWLFPPIMCFLLKTNRTAGVMSPYCAGDLRMEGHGWNSIVLSPKRGQKHKPTDRPLWMNCRGALAVLMTRWAAEKFLRDRVRPHQKRGTDHVLGEWCYRSRLTYSVHNPSLVQHIGAVSSVRTDSGKPHGIGLTASRTAADFVADVSQLPTQTQTIIEGMQHVHG